MTMTSSFRSMPAVGIPVAPLLVVSALLMVGLPPVTRNYRCALADADSAEIAEERVHVGGELCVILEQEPVCRVGVDLHACLRNQPGEQIGEARQDHRVAVA